MTGNHGDDPIQYRAGTPEEGQFFGDGKKSGHGTAAWIPAPASQLPDLPPWLDSGRHQVIALLDTGVQPHDWLPAGGGSPFAVDAGEYGWTALTPAILEVGSSPPYGTHWGHATFIAGLIRLAAPQAQILSMRVMDAAGQASDSDVVSALNWLADGRVRVDVALMAFGRRANPGDPSLDDLRAALGRLSALKVKIVASAGNEHSARPVCPAAFATDPSLSVVSVGALSSPTQWAPYSDYGPWVREARKGTNIVSSLPLASAGAGLQQVSPDAFGGAGPAVDTSGFAWWSGTSFAAAIYAGQLASQMPAGEGLPVPAPGP